MPSFDSPNEKGSPVVHEEWLVARVGAVLLALAAVSCGSRGEPASDGAQSAGNQVDGGAQGDLDGGAASCSSDLAVEGCACDGTRPSAACWTGPAADRRRGACRDATATCVQRGEFYVWGPCEGEALDCRGGRMGDGGSGADAGGSPPNAPCGASAGPTPACGCVPGVTIACEDDCSGGIACDMTASKTCLPDGTWGPCHEGGGSLDAKCRVFGYGCCGDKSTGCNGGNGYYVGDCSGVFTCPFVAAQSIKAVASEGKVTCSEAPDGPLPPSLP